MYLDSSQHSIVSEIWPPLFSRYKESIFHLKFLWPVSGKSVERKVRVTFLLFNFLKLLMVSKSMFYILGQCVLNLINTIYKPMRKAVDGTNPANTSISNFYPPELWEKIISVEVVQSVVLCHSSPIHYCQWWEEPASEQKKISIC